MPAADPNLRKPPAASVNMKAPWKRNSCRILYIRPLFTLELPFLPKQQPSFGGREIAKDYRLCFPVVSLGDEAVFGVLLANGYTLDKSLLLEAVRKGNLAIAEAILKHELILPDRNRNNPSPLQEAVVKKDLEMIHLLIRYGEDVNEEPRSDRGRSALQQAVEHGNLEIIDIPFKSGVAVNGRPAEVRGATALQLAALKGFIGIAKLLLDLEPPANANARPAPEGGRTALEGAAEHGRIDMVQLLLNYGAKTTGNGQRQYLRAIKFAETEGHDGAAAILREHRELTVLEEELLRYDSGLLDDEA